MKRKWISLKILGIVFFLFAFFAYGDAQAQEILYGADGAGGHPSNLYILNPSNGAIISTVGPIGYAITGLAVDPTTGELYGSVGNNDPVAPGALVRINRTTGAGTIVGYYGQSGQTMADLTFCPSRILYGWLEPISDDLYTINTSTGAATIVGESNLGTYGSGLACSSSGMLYFAGRGNAGNLYTINPSTGVPTTVATLSGGPGDPGTPVSALAFNASGVLYGVVKEFEGGAAYLVTINTSTGAIINLGQTVDRLDAIVFAGGTPAPSRAVPAMTNWAIGILVVTLGIISLYYIKRRRNAFDT